MKVENDTIYSNYFLSAEFDIGFIEFYLPFRLVQSDLFMQISFAARDHEPFELLICR